MLIVVGKGWLDYYHGTTLPRFDVELDSGEFITSMESEHVIAMLPGPIQEVGASRTLHLKHYK